MSQRQLSHQSSSQCEGQITKAGNLERTAQLSSNLAGCRALWNNPFVHCEDVPLSRHLSIGLIKGCLANSQAGGDEAGKPN